MLDFKRKIHQNPISTGALRQIPLPAGSPDSLVGFNTYF